MPLQELHDHVKSLFPGEKQRLTRTLVHALIDLKQITKICCAWDQCVLPGIPLAPSGIHRDSITIDHIIALGDDGTDDWSNIQLMHHTCNMRKGAKFTDERRAKISAASKVKWQDPEYRAKTAAAALAGNLTPEVSAKRRASMKAHWADPERRAQHLAAIAAGVTPEVIAQRNAGVQRAWDHRRGVDSC